MYHRTLLNITIRIATDYCKQFLFAKLKFLSTNKSGMSREVTLTIASQ